MLSRSIILSHVLLFAAIQLGQGCQQAPSAEQSKNSPPELGQTPTDGPAFREMAEAVGIDFSHFNGMSGEFYYFEMMGPGGALFDLDNDGDLDVYLVQGALLGPGKTLADALSPLSETPAVGDRLYRNDLLPAAASGSKTLRFVDVTAESGLSANGYGMGVAAGDFNNDGWTDLYITNFGANQLLRNNRDGSFSDVTDESGTAGASWSVSAAFLEDLGIDDQLLEGGFQGLDGGGI